MNSIYHKDQWIYQVYNFCLFLRFFCIMENMYRHFRGLSLSRLPGLQTFPLPYATLQINIKYTNAKNIGKYLEMLCKWESSKIFSLESHKLGQFTNFGFSSRKDCRNWQTVPKMSKRILLFVSWIMIFDKITIVKYKISLL